MTTFRWLIEAPGPRYLGVRELTSRHDFIWTSDHDKALRFETQEQADLMMNALRCLDRKLFGFDETLEPARATEHGWMDDGRPADQFRQRLGEMLEGAAERINAVR
jgi:hypothetical protein